MEKGEGRTEEMLVCYVWMLDQRREAAGRED